MNLGLRGGNDIVWIYQSRIPSKTGTKRLHLAFLPLDQTPPAFRPLNQSELGGEIVMAAVRQRRLHGFFRDGTHLRFEPEVRRVGGARADFPELNLPERGVPLALAGDSAADVLYALVPGRVAEALDVEPAPADAGTPGLEPAGMASGVAASDEPPRGGLEVRAAPEPVNQPVTQPATTSRPVLSRYCLVRFERGRWHRDRELPTFFDHHASAILAAEDRVCDLYFTYSAEPDTIWMSASAGETWSEPVRVRGAGREPMLACRRAQGRSDVLLHESGRVVLLRREGEAWRETASIAVEGAPAGSLAGDHIALGFADAAGGARAGLWGLDGREVLPVQAVEALQPPANVRGLQSFRTIAPFVVLGFSLLYVFSRRRESVVFPAVLAPNQRLAGFGRRAVAFVIDLVVVAPVALPLLYGWSRHLDPGLEYFEAVQIAMAEHFADLFWRWSLALAVLVVYGILFEGFRGGTPGKMLTGCRVVNDRGGPCGWRAAVARNLVRLLELFPGFDFAPLLLLIFLTRNRQRLGDLVARSVVVELRPETESAAAGDDEQADRPP